MVKPIAAVVFEGTVALDADADLGTIGEWAPGVREKLTALRETHTVLIVSAFARTDGGVRRLTAMMYQDDIPFDDVWCGLGVPVCDRMYDNRAEKL